MSKRKFAPKRDRTGMRSDNWPKVRGAARKRGHSHDADRMSAKRKSAGYVMTNYDYDNGFYKRAVFARFAWETRSK